MKLAVGEIVSGKVTTITKFGAFVALEDGKSGLVHISEVANGFVKDVNDFLKSGQEVQVKVLSVTPEGRINLSVKQALPRPARESNDRGAFRAPRPAPAPPAQSTASPAEASFEDKLKQFLSTSDSKMSELNRYRDNKRGSRRRK